MALTAEETAELAALKEDLSQVRIAIRAILTGAQSYTLDTGQSRQTVTKANLTELRKLRQELQAEVAELEAKQAGTRTYHGRPGF